MLIGRGYQGHSRLRRQSVGTEHWEDCFLSRQRPGTASGVTVLTLEDETGHVNVVVWRGLAERQRRALLGARLLAVYGTLERQGEVVHLIAGHLRDLTPLLGSVVTHSRDFH